MLPRTVLMLVVISWMSQLNKWLTRRKHLRTTEKSQSESWRQEEERTAATCLTHSVLRQKLRWGMDVHLAVIVDSMQGGVASYCHCGRCSMYGMLLLFFLLHHYALVTLIWYSIHTWNRFGCPEKRPKCSNCWFWSVIVAAPRPVLRYILMHG